MYERIFAYYDQQERRRSLGWLRLFDSPAGVVAVLSDIPGNPGSAMLTTVSDATATVVEQCHLAVPSLTVVVHLWPTGPGESKEEFRHISFRWEKHEEQLRPLAPTWRLVNRMAVELLVGEALLNRPFWHRDEEQRAMACVVGERRGAVWRVTSSLAWSAMLGPTATAPQQVASGFEYSWQAQGWVLNLLALQASEFDALPSWLQKK